MSISFPCLFGCSPQSNKSRDFVPILGERTFLRVHFTNIAVESCRIETFCTLQPSVSLVSKYLARSLRNNKQDTSRVRFSRRTRFWTLFFCQTVAKSPKSQFLTHGVKRTASGVISIWKKQNGVATTNHGFEDFPTVWEKNRVQKRVLRKKLTLRRFVCCFWAYWPDISRQNQPMAGGSKMSL